MKQKIQQKKFTNISLLPETKNMILVEAKRIDSYDRFLRKLLVLKKRHEEEFAQIEVDCD